jgi:hypothetical protein
MSSISLANNNRLRILIWNLVWGEPGQSLQLLVSQRPIWLLKEFSANVSHCDCDGGELGTKMLDHHFPRQSFIVAE